MMFKLENLLSRVIMMWLSRWRSSDRNPWSMWCALCSTSQWHQVLPPTFPWLQLPPTPHSQTVPQLILEYVELSILFFLGICRASNKPAECARGHGSSFTKAAKLFMSVCTSWSIVGGQACYTNFSSSGASLQRSAVFRHVPFAHPLFASFRHFHGNLQYLAQAGRTMLVFNNGAGP